MFLDFIALSVAIAVIVKCVQSLINDGNDLEKDEEHLYTRHRLFEIFNKKTMTNYKN